MDELSLWMTGMFAEAILQNFCFKRSQSFIKTTIDTQIDDSSED
jgi:hypothetical protein